MGLKEYNKKRNFKKTPEPRGAVKTSPTPGLQFVIQKHDASRLHYDFRLELEGVLLSWAVPKGPSLDPADKRLAVHVEDHPIDYGSFEGIIPEGQYGGGTVLLWDRGEWFPAGDGKEGYKKGRLKFELKGKKLKGHWMLVRMPGEEGKNWLLIKERDKYARDAADYDVTVKQAKSVSTGRSIEQIAKAQDRVWQSNREEKKTKTRLEELKSNQSPDRSATKGGGKPGSRATVKNHNRAASKTLAQPSVRAAARKPAVKKKPSQSATLPHVDRGVKAPFPKPFLPQLAMLVKQPPVGSDWIHEIKFDGYRILAFVRNAKVALYSRTGHDWTARFRTIADALSHVAADDCVIDGEVVVLKETGATDFQSLQNAMNNGRQQDLTYFAFDLLYANGRSLESLPNLERKEALEALIERAGFPEQRVRYSRHYDEEGRDVLANACRLGLEGIISKRRDAEYLHKRGPYWLKSKCIQRQEFVIGGYTEPSGSRKGLGALLVGAYDDADNLHFTGKVGTGFTHASLKELEARLSRLERATPPFIDAPRGYKVRGTHWIEPRHVCEVEFTEMTSDNKLRHPSFQGLREDKKPTEVKLEKPASAAEVAAKPRSLR